MNTETQKAIIVALDFPSGPEALALADRLDPAQCRVKVGKELFTRAGPAVVEALHTRGFEVFLDLKFHDIPNTVAGACRAAADLGVWMVNVHTLGGRRMMEAAREAIAGASHRPLLIGVTVLTSMGESDLDEIGLSGGAEQNVRRLALLAQASGLDGVVCSPREIAVIREACGTGFSTVTPGIRPAWAATDDQTRITTPADAVAAGGNYLVIGRPVTAAADPVDALRRIQHEIEQPAQS